MSSKKRLLITAGAVLVCAAIAYWLFLSSFSPKGNGAYVYIDQDDTADSVYTKLDRAASPHQLIGLRLSCALLGYGSHVRPGRYEAGGGVSSLRLARNLRNGRQSAVHLVIPVVHTLGDLASRFASELQADSAQFIQAITDPVALKACGVDTFMAPALFIPNTYDVYWDIKPAQLLKRMKKEHDLYWTAERRRQAKAAGLTPDEAYTLASIIEQETANKQERPMIAGMYLNRLHQGMKLQADPTVKFALQDFGLRRIMHGHLTADSPYNTYRVTGLPAGPICIPSLNAIEAVLHYAHHDYLYMCAKEDFSGRHNFAVTYDEHMANAHRYAAALNARGIK